MNHHDDDIVKMLKDYKFLLAYMSVMLTLITLALIFWR